jgi:hypothetical protein
MSERADEVTCGSSRRTDKPVWTWRCRSVVDCLREACNLIVRGSAVDYSWEIAERTNRGGSTVVRLLILLKLTVTGTAAPTCICEQAIA